MSQTVLIVEDNDIVRSSLQDWLSVTFPEFTFMIAKSGEEAVRKVVNRPPAIVLMDIGLPRMNGSSMQGRLQHEGVFRVHY